MYMKISQLQEYQLMDHLIHECYDSDTIEKEGKERLEESLSDILSKIQDWLEERRQRKYRLKYLEKDDKKVFFTEVDGQNIMLFFEGNSLVDEQRFSSFNAMEEYANGLIGEGFEEQNRESHLRRALKFVVRLAGRLLRIGGLVALAFGVVFLATIALGVSVMAAIAVSQFYVLPGIALIGGGWFLVSAGQPQEEPEELRDYR